MSVGLCERVSLVSVQPSQVKPIEVITTLRASAWHTHARTHLKGKFLCKNFMEYHSTSVYIHCLAEGFAKKQLGGHVVRCPRRCCLSPYEAKVAQLDFAAIRR